jgi:hypothetical protein
VFNRIVPEWFFRCRRFVIYELADKSSEIIQPDSDSVSVRWCSTDSEFDAVSEVTYVDPKLLPAGVTAVIAEVGNDVAGGIWCQAGSKFPENELGISLTLDKEQAWLFGAREDPKFRQRGVYGQILAFAIPSLAQRRTQKILVAVNPDNKASNRIHQRWSNKKVGKVFAARLISIVFCWSWGEAKCKRHFSFNSKTNPIPVQFSPEPVPK